MIVSTYFTNRDGLASQNICSVRNIFIVAASTSTTLVNVPLMRLKAAKSSPCTSKSCSTRLSTIPAHTFLVSACASASALDSSADFSERASVRSASSHSCPETAPTSSMISAAFLSMFIFWSALLSSEDFEAEGFDKDFLRLLAERTACIGVRTALSERFLFNGVILEIARASSSSTSSDAEFIDVSVLRLSLNQRKRKRSRIMSLIVSSSCESSSRSTRAVWICVRTGSSR
mmetsp:Transcript_25512/g.41164  ORF Transcript_25512/g.41164 Transcript_25512/m.41164 type:complete len:232 (-) Transcript_25512:2474-3169(-)